ncbi:hypothetical protein GCM10011338_21260 [Alteromonas lipolytica]|nr:hypothetical protein GCM10011338_21260 [Alteromonas lipolytica]
MQLETTCQEPTETALTGAELVAETKRLLASAQFGSSMAAVARGYQMVSALNAEQTLEALNLLDLYDDPESMRLVHMFLEHLASLSPLEAMDFVATNLHSARQKEMASFTVLRAWAEAQPEAALDWYLSDPDEANSGSLSHYGLMTLYFSYAEKNIEQAVSSVANRFSKTDYAAIEMAFSGIASSLKTTADFEFVLANLAELDNEKALSRVYLSWASIDPHSALNRLASQTNSESREHIKETVYRQWMYDSPAEASVAYMESAPPAERQSRA